MPDQIFKESQYQNIFWNEAPYSVAKVDLGGRVINCNKALVNLLGYSKDELSQLTFDAITQPDDLVRDRRLFSDLVVGKIKKYTMNKRYVTKGNVVLLASLTVYGHYDGDDKLTHCIGIIMPVNVYGSSLWSFIAKDWGKVKKVSWGVFAGLIIYLAKKVFDIDLSEFLK